ncbi:hypothetical protein C8Q78DRAFT_1014733, partial [Trametes maxima]
MCRAARPKITFICPLRVMLWGEARAGTFCEGGAGAGAFLIPPPLLSPSVRSPVNGRFYARTHALLLLHFSYVQVVRRLPIPVVLYHTTYLSHSLRLL